jgi:Putative beta barrel porin-7 (BBP7)
MKGVWKYSLSLSLSLLLGEAWAEEIQWHAAPPTTPVRSSPAVASGQAVSLGQPVAQGKAATQAPAPSPVVEPVRSAPPAPLADLGKPAPRGQVQPASFFTTAREPAVARGQDLEVPRPMPSAPGAAQGWTPPPPAEKLPKMPTPAAPDTPTMPATPDLTGPFPGGPEFPGGQELHTVPDEGLPVFPAEPPGGIPVGPETAVPHVAGSVAFPGMAEPVCADGEAGYAEESAGVPDRLYARAEYLMWWLKGQSVVAGTRLSPPMFSGGRFTAGYWWNDCHDFGIEGSFLFLPQRGAGGAALQTSSRLWAWELNARKPICEGVFVCPSGYRLDYHADLLGGFRSLGLDESLLPAGPTLLRTRDRFYGGQMGAQAGVRCGRWELDVLGKIAFGNTHQIVEQGPGHLNRDRLGVVPEANINLGYHVTGCVKVYVGYSFLYWSNVARPGDQLTRFATVRSTDFWAHGINFGVEARY